MTGKVAFAFLLTIATLFSVAFAVPVPEKNKNSQKVNAKDLETHFKHPVFEVCLIQCDTTGNKPVCGTDGKTYTSKRELSCHQACGLKVEVKHKGAC